MRGARRDRRQAARQPPRRRSAARSDLRRSRPSIGLPVLHHIWQHRTREWPSQEISDGADLARLAARHPRASLHPRAHRRRRRLRAHASPRCATCRTSFPISRAAASIAACSTTPLAALGAAAAAVGVRPHDGDRPRQAPRARGDRPVAPTSWPTFAGGTRRASFAPEAFRDASSAQRVGCGEPRPHDRRQRVHRPLSVSRSCRIPIRTCSCACSTREGLERRVGRPSAVGVSSRSDAGQRGAVRGARAASRTLRPVPVDASRLAALGAARSRDVAEHGRAGDPRVSAAVGDGPARSVDARARARLRRERASRSCSPCASRICASVTRSTSPATSRPRTCARSRARASAVRLVVTAAGREMIEEVHWGLTPDEQRRVLLGHLVDLGSAGGSPREAVSHDRRGAIRVRDAVAAAADAEPARESRSAARRSARRRRSPMRSALAPVRKTLT